MVRSAVGGDYNSAAWIICRTQATQTPDAGICTYGSPCSPGSSLFARSLLLCFAPVDLDEPSVLRWFDRCPAGTAASLRTPRRVPASTWYGAARRRPRSGHPDRVATWPAAGNMRDAAVLASHRLRARATVPPMVASLR